MLKYLLPSLALALETNLLQKTEPFDFYCHKGETLSFVVPGSAGQGAQWLQQVENDWVLSYKDSHHVYQAEESLGGHFELSMNFEAVQNGVSEIRLAYARPWEFDQNLMSASHDTWEHLTWNTRLITVHVVDEMKSVDLVTLFRDGKVEIEVKQGELVFIQLNETLDSKFDYYVTASKEESEPIQIVSDRYQKDESSSKGHRHIVFKANQLGHHFV